MDYSKLLKRIVLPESFKAPELLTSEGFYAKPLSRNDLEADIEGVNTSIEIIQKTRGGSWPSEPLTKDFDLLDLAWHEREFRDGNSFAYVIYTDSDEYIGCFYLYGVGLRTPLNEETIHYEVDASWWVTSNSYHAGYYDRVYRALRIWLQEEFKFTKIAYSNKEIPS